MAESLFEELKRYVHWSAVDEEALRALHATAAPRFGEIAETFYDAILNHEEARRALTGGETQVGHLKVTLRAWMDRLLLGPWDEDYFEARARIGRRPRPDRPAPALHVRRDERDPARAESGHRRHLPSRRRRARARACGGGENPRPRAGDHAAHVPRGSPRAGGQVGAPQHLRTARRLDRPRSPQPSRRDRELRVHPPRTRRARRARRQAPRSHQRAALDRQRDHHEPARHHPEPTGRASAGPARAAHRERGGFRPAPGGPHAHHRVPRGAGDRRRTRWPAPGVREPDRRMRSRRRYRQAP